MSAFATLVLANATPANISFAPSSIDSNGVAKWYVANSIFDARNSASLSVALPKANGTVSRVKMKVSRPIMDTVDTTLKVGEAYVNIEFVFPKRCTETDRLDLKAFAVSLLGHATATAAVQSLESAY